MNYYKWSQYCYIVLKEYIRYFSFLYKGQYFCWTHDFFPTVNKRPTHGRYVSNVRTFCPMSSLWLSLSASPSTRCVSADLYYLSKLNQTNREDSGIWVAAQGRKQEEKKKSAFFPLSKGMIVSSEDLVETHQGRSWGSSWNTPTVTFSGCIFGFFSETSCLVHSICSFCWAVYHWQVCRTTHTNFTLEHLKAYLYFAL